MKYAEELNYWKTSKSQPDTWIIRAKKEIETADGTIVAEAFVSEAAGRSAYMLAFQFGRDNFRITWPLLESKTGNIQAAKVQAATFLYYDVKNACIKAKVFGARVAFFHALLLPDGRTASEATGAELLEMTPQLLLGK